MCYTRAMSWHGELSQAELDDHLELQRNRVKSKRVDAKGGINASAESLQELQARAQKILDKRTAKLKEKPDDEQERNKAKGELLRKAETTLEKHGIREEVKLRYQGHQGEVSYAVMGVRRTTPPVTVDGRMIILGDSDLRAVSDHQYVREKGYVRVIDPDNPQLDDGGSIYVFGQELADRGSFVSVERSTRASIDEIREAISLVNLIDASLSAPSRLPQGGEIRPEAQG